MLGQGCGAEARRGGARSLKGAPHPRWPFRSLAAAEVAGRDRPTFFGIVPFFSGIRRAAAGGMLLREAAVAFDFLRGGAVPRSVAACAAVWNSWLASF